MRNMRLRNMKCEGRILQVCNYLESYCHADIPFRSKRDTGNFCLLYVKMIETLGFFLGTLTKKMYIFLLNFKKALKNFALTIWCTEKPFGYRVVHHTFYISG